ncbi:MAG: hypothetical protein KA223_08740, partial [Candidatus Accumulibacter sp.]|nr:hypothetical protein [Accumulibacter sp.]
MSGDALAAAGLISGAAAGEVQGDELAPTDATYVVVDSPADGRGLDWLLSSEGTPLGSFPVFGQSNFVALSVAQDQAPAAEHETHFLDADLNADGRSDRIEIGPRADGIAVARQWLAAGDGFSPGQSSELGIWQADSRYLPGDLDGDGRSDLTVIQAQADGGITADTWLAGDEGLLRAGRSALGRYPAGSEYTLSDTTGDGRADLVVHWLPGDDTRRFTLWRGNGREFAPTADHDSYGQGPVPSRPLQLDVNADGLGDLVYLELDSSEDPLTSDTSTWLTTLRGRADGDWDVDYQNFGVWAQTVQILVGNSEADGRQDLLRLWHDEHGQLQLTPWRSNGYGFTAGETSPLGSPQPEQQFHAADVDGDGRSDVLQIWQDAGGQAQATLWRATPVGDGVRYHESSTASLGVWRDDAQWTLADHNGDHRADLVATWQVADGQQQLAVWLSDGQGFTGQNGWQDDLAWFDADFNADGRNDRLEISHRADGIAVARAWLAFADGFAEGDRSELGTWRADNHYLTGDLDGDGRSDLTVIRTPADGAVVAETWLASDDGLLRAGRSELGRYPAGSQYTLSDTTGDGRADLAVRWLPGNDTTRFTLWQGDGHEFQPAASQETYWEDLSPAPPLTLDISGDGLGDLVHLQRNPYEDPLTSDASTWLASLRGRADVDWDIDYQNFGVWAQTVQVLVGDTDADGLHDLLRLWQDELGQIQLTPWYSDGYSFSAGNPSAFGSPRPEQQFHAADVDGDGRTDVVQVWRDAAGHALARAWLASRQALTASSVLGPWIDDARLQLLPHATGRADLVRTWLAASGARHLETWRYSTGFVAVSSQTLPPALAEAPQMRFTQALPQADEPPAARHFEQTLPPIGSGDPGDGGPPGDTPQADFTVSDLRVDPPGDWSPGERITVSWTTTNAGRGDASGTWSERLEVRNSSTNELLARQEIVTETGDAPLASGESRPRALSFFWPAPALPSGQKKD